MLWMHPMQLFTGTEDAEEYQNKLKEISKSELTNRL
jgi:hypothetical protein